MPDPAATDASNRLAEDYDRRAAAHDRERQRLDALSQRWSLVRLALAGLALAAAVYGWAAGAWWGLPVAAVAVGAFLVVALAHARVDEGRRAEDVLSALDRDAAARLRRDWHRLVEWPDADDPPADAGHHVYAGDLDVFGHASVWRLLSRARSRRGDQVLRGWLLAPALPEVVAVRQAAARELAPALEWRQRLARHALDTRRMRLPELERFLAWAEGTSWLRRRPWLYAVVIALAAGTILLIAAGATGYVSGGWLATASAAVVLSLAVQRPLARVLEDASWETALRGWRQMADLATQMPAGTPHLAALRAQVAEGESHAARALDALERVIGFANVRHTPVLHWPLQAITLWDFHVWWAVEGWQRRHGPHVRGWLDALAEIEALAALAGLAHDHPGWAWPALDPAADRLDAGTVAHPLLPPGRAVANDVVVGPPGRLLFVTGSNMSGKSTLLRAIGVNAVLAQAGAPVCATHWRMPPLTVVTSMRVSDSLEDGVSFFMASLARLKLVVDHVRATADDPSRPMVLFLLDEVLGGTNTAEREVAVRGIVRHLAAHRAIGALTSHDLALADAPELRAHAEFVHFRESIAHEGGATSVAFDYRLRPGVASSRNALALMQVVGLGEVIE